MNLDEELRGTLTREAERRTAPPPDIVGIISGGRVRRRRRTVVRLGAVAAATVLVGSAAYGVLTVELSAPGTDQGPASTRDDSATPDLLPDNGVPLESGVTYRLPVGTDASGGAIEVDLAVEGMNWSVSGFPVVHYAYATFAGFGAYMPSALADGTGCLRDRTTSDLGDTPQDLAKRLTELPRSTVLESPTATEVFGRAAVHLRLRVDVDCPNYYRVAQTPRGDRGITYSGAGPNPESVVIDFWVLDIDGTPVVVDQWRDNDAPRDLVDMARRARESITFVVD
ncbi:hypothetical protein [Nocardioides terrigena]|uniref:hypothetical protein n=1 Tax=Nocardioides terrigena TaxID=424797 RepID=UPI000D310E3B|nr:hypothetical protein [Nocardioides terrigena]